MDIRASIEKAVETISQDKALQEQFKTEPVAAIEKLLGVDLPDEKLQPLVTGIKAKLAAADIGGKLGGLKNLF